MSRTLETTLLCNTSFRTLSYLKLYTYTDRLSRSGNVCAQHSGQLTCISSSSGPSHIQRKLLLIERYDRVTKDAGSDDVVGSKVKMQIIALNLDVDLRALVGQLHDHPCVAL